MFNENYFKIFPLLFLQKIREIQVIQDERRNSSNSSIKGSCLDRSFDNQSNSSMRSTRYSNEEHSSNTSPQKISAHKLFVNASLNSIQSVESTV